MAINWNEMKTTKDEYGIIAKIAERATKTVKRDHMSIMMDIEVVHNSVGLRLSDLLAAPNFDFLHDVCGIISNLDRYTGELLNCFLPRYSA